MQATYETAARSFTAAGLLRNVGAIFLSVDIGTSLATTLIHDERRGPVATTSHIGRDRLMIGCAPGFGRCTDDGASRKPTWANIMQVGIMRLCIIKLDRRCQPAMPCDLRGMNHFSHQTKATLATAVLLEFALSGSSTAGIQVAAPVAVDLVTRHAWGAIGSTRNAPVDQLLYCDLFAYGTSGQLQIACTAQTPDPTVVFFPMSRHRPDCIVATRRSDDHRHS